MMRWKWALFAVAAVLIGAAAGALSRWRRAPVEAVAPAAKTAPAPPGEVSLPGRIAAQHVTAVTPQIAGQIETFLVDVGQEVAEGQLLARISNQGLETVRQAAAVETENAQARVNRIASGIVAARLEASRARADLSRAQNEFDKAQRLYQRQKLLNEAGATPRLTYKKSEKEFQLAESDYRGTEALAKQADDRVAELTGELESARRILDDKRRQLEDAQSGVLASEVHSPVNGLIVARYGEPGRQQEQGAALFEIATDLSALLVEVEPEPPVLARIKAGQAALVFLADVPEAISGQVNEVQNGRASVAFTNASTVVKPGMTAQVRIRLQ
jgi:multidrug efflux pump subunit AcrA (membrane-fusion protein)